MRDHRPPVCIVPSAPPCRMYARWCAWWCPERVPPALRHRRCCQFLAQTPHPYTSPEKGRKALLERLCQGMHRVAVHTDHPPRPPPDDARHCRPFLAPPHQALALSTPPRGGHATQPAFPPEHDLMGQPG